MLNAFLKLLSMQTTLVNILQGLWTVPKYFWIHKSSNVKSKFCWFTM